MRARLSQLLGVNVLLEADNGQSAIEAVHVDLKPDLVVLDLGHPPHERARCHAAHARAPEPCAS